MSLVAYAANVETTESFSVKLVPGADGTHVGTLPPLPPGLYRLSVKGGPEVIPVSDVFAVFHRAGQLPEAPEKPLTFVVVPESFSAPGQLRDTTPLQKAAPLVRNEGQAISRACR